MYSHISNVNIFRVACSADFSIFLRFAESRPESGSGKTGGMKNAPAADVSDRGGILTGFYAASSSNISAPFVFRKRKRRKDAARYAANTKSRKILAGRPILLKTRK